MEKKSTDGQEQLENGRLIPKLRRTIRKYKSRIIFILILLLFFLKLDILPDILPDLIEHELLGVCIYMIVQGILWVLILLLIILHIISLGEKSTDGQEQLENGRLIPKLRRTIRKYKSEIIFILILLLICFLPLLIGRICAFLGISTIVVRILWVLDLLVTILLIIIFLHAPFSDFVKEEVKAEGYAKVPKITIVTCFVCAILIFMFILMPSARNFVASFDPPSIELTQLSAKYSQASTCGANEYDTSSDSWTLYGVDSNGKKYTLSIDEDDWDRLESVGKRIQVKWDLYYLEFDDDVRLVGHYLPGWLTGAGLLDFEIIE